MSLIIATGTNLGARVTHLQNAKEALLDLFVLVAESRIYQSSAVDYFDQPDFLNQVLEFQTPDMEPTLVMKKLLSLEQSLGRIRDVPRGPRIIDIDLLFFDLKSVQTDFLTLPHPRLFQRGFVVIPLSELPYFAQLKKHFTFSFDFSHSSTIFTDH